MTQPLTPALDGPPLPGGAGVGDVIWVPAFASTLLGGNPFWLRVISAGRVEGNVQTVMGAHVVPYGQAYRSPESERTVTVELPLDRTCRRIFEATP